MEIVLAVLVLVAMVLVFLLLAILGFIKRFLDK